MDGPPSNLDARLRVSMHAQISLLHERLGITPLYVTRDQTEAMTLGRPERDGPARRRAAAVQHPDPVVRR